MSGFMFSENSEMTGKTWLGTAILHRGAPNSLYHIIYIKREPISLCLSNVQNAKSFFRLGLLSPSSIRATLLPACEQIASPAAEIGRLHKRLREWNASHCTMHRRFHMSVLPGWDDPSGRISSILPQ
jgi:hypothetical protein